MIDDGGVMVRLRRTQERIAEAALRSGHSPDAVRLVAITKTHPVGMILEAWAAGQREFGENRPEEAAEKIPSINRGVSGGRPIWHMVGHIQQRKSSLILEHFQMVHSIDRVEPAVRLSRLAGEAGRTLPVLLECNVSGEASKYGFGVARWNQDDAVREAFFGAVQQVLALPALSVEGLMTMAPIVDEPEQVRPVFAGLRTLRDALCERFPGHAWPHLSMGMSDDFEVAIEEGATLVRIGRAIFGERQP